VLIEFNKLPGNYKAPGSRIEATKNREQSTKGSNFISKGNYIAVVHKEQTKDGGVVVLGDTENNDIRCIDKLIFPI